MKNNILKSFIFILTAFISSVLVYPNVSFADTLTDTDNYEYIVQNNEIYLEKYIGNLEDVVIPEKINGMNVVGILNTTFLDNDTMKKVYIPKTVKDIETTSFSNCSLLESITVDENNISFISDNGVLFSKDQSIILAYPAGKSGEYYVDSSVKIIGEAAFSSSIISSVIIPDGVQRIEAEAFYNCDYVTRIVIPKTVEYLGGGAFGACDDLVYLDVSDENPKYKSDNGDIYSKDNITIVAVASGVSGIYNIKNGVQRIGEYAFAGSSYSIINIPDTVEIIENCAFWCSDYLEEVTIPSNVREIRTYAFYLCSSLKEVSFSSGIKEIENSAFAQCINLEKINFTRATPPLIADKTFFGSINNTITITIPQVYKSRYEQVFNKYVTETSSINYAYCDCEKTLIEDCTFDNISNQEYSGKEITDVNINVYDGEWKLTKNVDYDITFENNINVGEAKVIISGMGAYSGQTYISFDIEQKDISSLYINNISSVTYSGKLNKPNVIIVDKNINYTLINDLDYELIYDENTLTNVGTGAITVVGKGQYSGSKKVYFKINRKNIQTSVAITGIGTKNYTGNNIYQAYTVKYSGIKLKKGIDFTLTYSYNKYPGKATMKFTFIGNYAGTKSINFDIRPSKVAGLSYSTRTNKSIKIKWSSVKGVSYYEVYRYDKSKKKYIYLTKTTNNYYTNNSLSSGSYYSYKVRAVKKTSKGVIYGYYSNTKGIYTCPATPSIKLTTFNKKVYVKWGKVSSASGYEVYYRIKGSSKFYRKAVINSKSKISFTHNSLKKGKIYYYKVRSYKLVNGTKIYGTFSTIKYIKVKGL